ncbi:hypothetical protein KSD_17330 [Ktedonobacter sp. SOSP1-85]|uniref:DNA methyltransferase n=1 Tax=Ktedonobacter sp. SOSP1-85 TaxID=2778367 RepID=UPI0019155487|nr:DNA methyltransferase [Ktedonobacter sp. SOSP1-85]GHO73962.1 hypothetical protein KSD_17330 [Ktedonobacter sp. SOSP1-85]
MTPLTTDLRAILERAIMKAREASEEAAKAALATLAVMESDAFASLSADQKRLRISLRARARQLGDGDLAKGEQPLIEEVAYEQWHCRLFARFLAENGLLMHPEGAPVTLEECSELALEEGESDAWQVAARYASAMLPGIFRVDDPSAQVQFSPEGRHKLEVIVANLPPMLFLADDALGWVYQFWQTKKKAAVNNSERKRDGNDISPVTQLFTEHYMVQFLLENSLGAWWAARHPTSPLLQQYHYLRFQDDGTPAAGTFPGWPERAAEVTVMDPCCGSGHFLVAAFEMLCHMRMEEERLCAAEAADVVLRDNLFGLELDARCTQIAAFALALAAWKMGGYRDLPLPNVACSGIAVEGQLETWTQLAGDDVNLSYTLERQYKLFRNAPHLGSLIDPNNVPVKERMFASDYALVEPHLKQALAKERAKDDPTSAVFGAAAEGMGKAARLLAKTYTLVATNVPYLQGGKQNEILKRFCDEHYPDASADLATSFIERCRIFTVPCGSYAIVTPQNWLFLNSYKKMRLRLIREQTWNHIDRLGTGAFETISGEIVNIALLIMTNQSPTEEQVITGMDVSTSKFPQDKASQLRTLKLRCIEQMKQIENPDGRISLAQSVKSELLARFAYGVHGLNTKDSPRFIKCFWEIPYIDSNWKFIQSTIKKQESWGGMEHIVYWQKGQGVLNELGKKGWAILAGGRAWGKKGICISQMGKLPASLYSGDIFTENVAAILPQDSAHLPAIWAFCHSSEFNEAVRQIDQAIKVTSATLVKVPFDLERWQRVADVAGPLPEPYSNDPTQWLFKGQPVDSMAPLQVAVARLLGYRWPQQETDVLDTCASNQGIVCLPSVAGAEPGVEQLRALLTAAYGEAWTPVLQERLLADAGYSGKSLEVWLRDGFFEQHCRLFHNRPFIWQVWDGRKDGFSALINYHRLDAAGLDRLIYTYLGSWIATQRDEQKAGVAGAEARLVAALKLQEKLIAISKGEKPYDIYVRWKPLDEQPIGWNPDLDDGVRLNIRPFVEAGVLRSRFTIHWNKDRGTNPDGSERLNDLHKTLAEKHAARVATIQWIAD